LKKLTAMLFCAAILLCLAGCSSDKTPDLPGYLSEPFSFTAEYMADSVYGQLVYRIDGVEACSLEYLAPETLAGMTVTLKDGVVTSQYKGIVTEVSYTVYEKQSPLLSIYKLLTSKAETASVTRIEGTADISLALSDGSRFVTSETALKSISIPSMGLEITVTDFQS